MKQKNNISTVILGIILALVLTASSMSVSFGSFVGSPNYQLESGVAAENITCNDDRVLVLRTSGDPACVKLSTSERLDWKIIGVSTVGNSSPGSPFTAKLTIDSPPNLNETAEITLTFAADRFNHDTIEQFPATIRLPDGLEIVSGELETTHFWQHGDTLEVTVTVKAIQTGNWTIQGFGYGGAADYLYLAVSEDSSYIPERNFPTNSSSKHYEADYP